MVLVTRRRSKVEVVFEPERTNERIVCGWGGGRHRKTDVEVGRREVLVVVKLSSLNLTNGLVEEERFANILNLWYCAF